MLARNQTAMSQPQGACRRAFGEIRARKQGYNSWLDVPDARSVAAAVS
jgi:hypothetical protein